MKPATAPFNRKSQGTTAGSTNGLHARIVRRRKVNHHASELSCGRRATFNGAPRFLTRSNHPMTIGVSPHIAASMRLGVNMPKRNLAWILIVGAIALLMWQLPQMIAGRDSVMRAFGPLVDARAQIQKRFVEKIDDDRLVTDAVDAAIRSMVRELKDPYAVYLNHEEYQRFQSRTDGLYGGVGMEVWSTDEGLEVLSREPNSPAYRAEILPGDIITRINDIEISAIPYVEIVNGLLNGPIDVPVKVTVISKRTGADPTPRDVTLYRTVIQLDPVHGFARTGDGGWRFMLDPVNRIGYVRLVKFTSNVDERLDEVMNGLFGRNLRGLVIDLRENTGGLLESANDVADRFLTNGLIVRTSGRKADTKHYYASPEGTYPNIPVAIVVNRTTASAAEIVAGALRDQKRAVVVGERTYGKGSVQEVVPLTSNNGAIKLTTAYYYLPNGECIHKTPAAKAAGTWGVSPNIVVELTADQRRDWEDAWREIDREPQPGDDAGGAMPTTSQSAENNDELPADGAETESALAPEVRRLLAADRQLRVAVDEVLKSLTNPKPSDRTRPESEDDEQAAETH